MHVGVVASSKFTPSTTVDVRLLGRRRDDHLARAGLEVLRRVCALAEEAGRLDHDVDAELVPRQRCGVGLGEDGDLGAVDDEHVAARPRSCRETARRRVSCLSRCASVSTPVRSLSADPLDVEPALVRRAEGGATRPPEAVDRNSYSHGSSFVGFSRPTLGRARRSRHRRKRARACGALPTREQPPHAEAGEDEQQEADGRPAMTRRSSRRAVGCSTAPRRSRPSWRRGAARRASRRPRAPGRRRRAAAACRRRAARPAAACRRARRRSRSASRSAAGSCRRTRAPGRGSARTSSASAQRRHRAEVERLRDDRDPDLVALLRSRPRRSPFSASTCAFGIFALNGRKVWRVSR